MLSIKNEQKLRSQWICPLPACLCSAPGSVGQLIIPVYDVKSTGGHSNALVFLETGSLSVCVCVSGCVKNQLNSTKVESVGNKALIYVCACPSWKKRA